jgi:hypothetical protein
MTRSKSSRAREHRIWQEIVVDAYDTSETSLSWYYYLEEALKFPFLAECLTSNKALKLRRGQRLNVLSLASEDECASRILVVIEAAGCRSICPLSDLAPIGAGRATRQGMEDWSYWVGRGYEF